MGNNGEAADTVLLAEGSGTSEADGILLLAAALRQITDAFKSAFRSRGPSMLREPPVVLQDGHA